MNLKHVSEFKQKLEEIRTDLIGGLAKTRRSSNEEEFTQLVSDVTDDASRSYTRQMLLNLGEQELEKLKLVEEALYKIKNGGYGICILCENAIPEARLKVVPFAQYCVACLSRIEKEKEHEPDIGLAP